MPGKRAPIKIEKQNFFSFPKKLQQEILEQSGLDPDEIQPLADAISYIVNQYHFGEYIKQVKPNVSSKFLRDRKTGGKYLLLQAKDMLETLRGFSEYEINLLSLKYLKEELEFFAEPNYQLYSREDCDKGSISEYEIPYLDLVCRLHDKRFGKSEDKRKLSPKEEESKKKYPKRKIEKVEMLPSNYDRTLEAIEKQPVSRSVKKEKKDRERIKKELEDIFFRFAKFDKDNFDEKSLKQEKKDAVNIFTQLILKEVNLQPKKREKYKKAISKKI